MFYSSPQVSQVQKLETTQIQLRETYDRQKMDVQNLSVEKRQLEKHLETKVIVPAIQPITNPNTICCISKLPTHPLHAPHMTPQIHCFSYDHVSLPHTSLPQSRLKASLESDLSALRGTVESLTKELGTELLSQLTSDEQVCFLCV